MNATPGDPADIAEGYEIVQRTQAGDWLYSEVRVMNADTRTAAAAGHLLVEGSPVARISANFRMARARA